MNFRLKMVDMIQVPVTDLAKQRCFAEAYAHVQAARKLNQQTDDELEAIMPTALDRAFAGAI